MVQDKDTKQPKENCELNKIKKKMLKVYPVEYKKQIKSTSYIVKSKYNFKYKIRTPNNQKKIVS